MVSPFFTFVLFFFRYYRFDHFDKFIPVLLGLRQQTYSGGGFFGKVGWCGFAQYVLDITGVRGSPQNLRYAGSFVQPSWAGEHRVFGGVVRVHAVMDESTDDASSDTVRYALVVRRAVILYALAIALRFLAVLTPIVTQVGDAYRSLLLVTVLSRDRFAWTGPPTFGIRRPMAVANSVAFLDTVAMCFVNDRRVFSSTPRYLIAGFTGIT